MLRKIIAALVCMLPLTAPAQNVISSRQMVAVTPMLSDKADLPSAAKSLLAQKLGQIATQNGFGSVSGQIVLTANAVTVDKTATATAPVQLVVKMDVTLYVIDLTDGTVIDSYTFEVQGIDNSDHKAVVKAIAQIKPKSPGVRSFMTRVRGKIIDYYTTHIPAIITKAQTLEKMGRPNEALALLSSVPDIIDEYPAVAEQMRQIAGRIGEEGGYTALEDSAKQVFVQRILIDALNRWYVSNFLSVN